MITRRIDAGPPLLAALPSNSGRFHEDLANRQPDGRGSASFVRADLMIEHTAVWSQGDVERATNQWLGGLAKPFVHFNYLLLYIRCELTAEIGAPFKETVSAV